MDKKFVRVISPDGSERATFEIDPDDAGRAINLAQEVARDDDIIAVDDGVFRVRTVVRSR